MNPPADEAAEAGALACVVDSNGDGAAMLDQLSEADFSEQRNLTIFRTLLVLQFDGAVLSVVSLAQHLKDAGELDAAGGLDYIQRLPDQTPSPENFPSFLATVKDRTARRAKLVEAEAMRRAAYDLSAPIDGKPKSNLPAVEDAAAFASVALPEPQQLIRGVLHRGCKLALGGGSKTFKTWTLLDLALSVSHGEPWLSFKTTRSRACYVNLELPAWGFHSRLLAVARAKQITMQTGRLRVWNLRGHATTYTELLPMLGAELRKEELGLLIIDPIYKLYGDTDENSARDVSALLNQFERLAQETGAAIAFASHFSKGNQAGKEAVDRISGSGVFARDPDAIITFTRHEEDSAFAVDSTLRNCSTIEPFVVRWQYPLMRKDDDLDPTRLKQAKMKTATYTVPMIIKCLGKRKLTTSEWQKRCADEAGVTRTTFYRLLPDAEKFKLVTRNGKGKWQVSQVPQVPNDPSGTSDTPKSHTPLGDGTGTESEKTQSKSKATREAA